MTTVLDVFRQFGDTTHVAALLDVSDQAVRNMRSRGIIPPRHFPTLVRESSRRKIKGITLETLVSLNARASKTTREAA